MGMLTQRMARLGSNVNRKIVVGIVPVILRVKSTVEMYIKRNTAHTIHLEEV